MEKEKEIKVNIDGVQEILKCSHIEKGGLLVIDCGIDIKPELFDIIKERLMALKKDTNWKGDFLLLSGANFVAVNANISCVLKYLIKRKIKLLIDKIRFKEE